MKVIYSLLQLLGVILLFYFPIGTVVGLILIILGAVQTKAIPKLVKCPKCKEDIIKGAEVCKHCGAEQEKEEKNQQTEEQGNGGEPPLKKGERWEPPF